MKYYVVSDIHSFYEYFIESGTLSGFFKDTDPHKLIICGDIFDRGPDAVKLQNFVAEGLEKDLVILIKGNHDELFESLIDFDIDDKRSMDMYIFNKTLDTAFQLTNLTEKDLEKDPQNFVKKAKETLYYSKLLPAMKDYYEVGNYIFVHGWIPFMGITGQLEKAIKENTIKYNPDWRKSSTFEFQCARWVNGIMLSQYVTEPNKTIICGHWHCSYGHFMFEKKGEEFGEKADNTPYYGKGIIAIDTCTAQSKKVNVLILNIDE